VQECLIREDGTISCTCMKPKLLHRPCSHVIAACRESGNVPNMYVSHYYMKEAIQATWNHEIYGYGMMGTFTQPNDPVWYIPDPALQIMHRGRRQTRRIRNGMDAAEAGKSVRCCSMCGEFGHNYKKCPLMELHGSAEAGPSGNPNDGAPPVFETGTASRPRPRRSVSSWRGGV
jgi:hypothetical protein